MMVRDEVRDTDIDIETAVNRVCEGFAYGGGGRLEALADRLEATVSLLGRLVETLANAGVLKPDEVITVLGSRFSEVDR